MAIKVSWISDDTCGEETIFEILIEFWQVLDLLEIESAISTWDEVEPLEE